MHYLSHRLRVALTALIATVAVVFASGLQAAPAQADNCQAEELVLQMFPPRTSGMPQDSPVPDESDPRCILLKWAGCSNAADPIGCFNGIWETSVQSRLP